VGQKIHPTGFRIGINKSHQSTWFSYYNTYSKILQEDYKIRQFFEKEWGKAVITKLEIKRQFGRIELFVHTARTRRIPNLYSTPITGTRKKRRRRPKQVISTHVVRDLVRKLKSDLNETRKVIVKVHQVAYNANASLLIARSLAEDLEKRVVFRKAMRKTTKRLEKWFKRNFIQGFKIQVSGRLNGNEIARSEWVLKGRVPLQTLKANIGYSAYKALTKYGILGIKVWIFNEDILNL